MHRSGTSALTRVLSLLGAELPKNLMGPNPSNEAGHWESNDLVVIHDELLASAGSNWHDWRAFNSDWYASGVAEPFKQRLLEVIERDFKGTNFFLVKDPRICRFAPLWLEVLDRFGAETHVVISIRNPLEVAASLQRRDGFPPARSYLLWLRHVLDTEYATRRLPRAIVNFEALIGDWRGLVRSIGTRARLHWPSRSDQTALEIDRFLAAALRHHVEEPARVAARSDVADWVKDTYSIMRRLAEGRESDSNHKRLDSIRSEFDQASAAFGLVLAGEVAHGRAQLSASDARVKTHEESLSALSQELAHVRAANAAREGERLDLVAELDAARQFLNSSQAEVQRLSSEIEKATFNAESANAEHAQAIASRDDHTRMLEQELDQTRNLRQSLAAELQLAQGAAVGWEQERAQLQQQLEAARTFLRESQGEMQRLAGDLDEAKRVSESATVERDQRMKERSQLAEELEAARQFLQQSQAELQRMAVSLDDARLTVERTATERAEVVQQLERELSSLQHARHGLAAELLSARRALDEQEQERTQLGEELEATRQYLQASQEERKRLADHLEEAKLDVERTAAALGHERGRAQTILVEREAVVRRLEQELAELDCSRRALAAEFHVVQSVATVREQENRQLLQRLDAAQQFIDESEANAQVLANERNDALESVAEREAQLEAMRQLQREGRAEFQQLAWALEEARRQIGQGEGRIRELNGQLDAAQGRSTQAAAELVCLSRESEQIRRQVEQSDAERARLASEAEAVRQKLQQTDALAERSRIERIRLGAALEETQQRLSDREARAAGFERDLTAVRSQLVDLQNTIKEQARMLGEMSQPAGGKGLLERLKLGSLLRPSDRKRKAARRWEYDAIRRSRLFDSVWYLERNPDVAHAEQDPLWHYILHGGAEGREPHPLFDSAWYRTQVPEFAELNISPLGHYVSIGASSGLDPHPLFDTDWYLSRNPEVADEHLNPLYHYMKSGVARKLDPNPFFDASWYLEQNPDVRSGGDNPLFHYIVFGGKEGRDPSPRFDARSYLRRHPDLKETGANPLVHFLLNRGPEKAEFGVGSANISERENEISASAAVISDPQFQGDVSRVVNEPAKSMSSRASMPVTVISNWKINLDN